MNDADDSSNHNEKRKNHDCQAVAASGGKANQVNIKSTARLTIEKTRGENRLLPMNLNRLHAFLVPS